MAQVSSLEVNWPFVLLLFGASVAAIVGLPLWVCLADLLLTPGVVIAVVGVCRRWSATWLCDGHNRLTVVILPCRFAAASQPLPPARRCVLQRSGLLLLGQNQHGERNNDGGSDCRRGAVGNVQRGDAHEHTGAVGDEPNEPHANAQAMEVVALFAIAAQQNVGRPGRVEEHERDGEATGDGVQK